MDDRGQVMIAGFVFLALLVWVAVQAFLYGEFDPVAAVIGVVDSRGLRGGARGPDVLASHPFQFTIRHGMLA